MVSPRVGVKTSFKWKFSHSFCLIHLWKALVECKVSRRKCRGGAWVRVRANASIIFIANCERLHLTDIDQSRRSPIADCGHGNEKCSGANGMRDTHEIFIRDFRSGRTRNAKQAVLEQPAAAHRQPAANRRRRAHQQQQAANLTQIAIRCVRAGKRRRKWVMSSPTECICHAYEHFSLDNIFGVEWKHLIGTLHTLFTLEFLVDISMRFSHSELFFPLALFIPGVRRATICATTRWMRPRRKSLLLNFWHIAAQQWDKGVFIHYCVAAWE